MIGRLLLLRHFAALLAGLAWSLVVRDAEAQDAEAQDAGVREVDHRVSITFAPMYLISPTMLRLTAELSLPCRFSAAGIVGKAWGDAPDWEVGVQARYYLLGNFNHGMPILMESLYNGGESSAFFLKPMVGYKLTLRVGFTIEVAAGAEFTFAGTGRYEDDRRVSPTVSLNVGWSF